MKLKDALAAGFVLLLAGTLATLWLIPTGLKQAPDVTLPGLDGQQISLSGFRGRPVLVNFWATTCPGCIREMPHLIDMHNTYADRGLVILGIAMYYDPPDQVVALRKRRQLPYLIALDMDGRAAQAFNNVRLTPNNFLIAPDGTIVRHKVGEFSAEELLKVRAQIEQMLPESGTDS
jgi:peroxiredoxin